MSRDRRQEIAALVGELAELAKNAPARLGRRLASLSVREQAELALRLPARQRLELLLHAPKPMRVVRSLPSSEFYLTVREVGPGDALPMVALGSAPQLQHLLDLESWRRDRFDADRSGAWVALLLDGGEPAVRRYLRSADDEQLSLLFQRWTRVQPIVPEDGHEKHGHGMTETGDERGLVSPDGNYRFSPRIREHGPAVQRIAQLLFLDEPDRYHRVLWTALHELPAELEEQALRWRDSRLEEHGFPPWDEAITVYAPPAGVRSHPRTPRPADPDGLAAPLSPLSLPAVREQLASTLGRLGDDDRDRVLHELFGLANHLIVADGGDTGDPEVHRTAVEKAAGYLGIALEARQAQGAADAATLLRVPLVELFREGFARTTELQKRARALTTDGWAAAHPRALELLDTPLRDRLEALLETRPMYFDVGDAERGDATRPFRSTAELDETAVALEIAEVVGGLLVGRCGLDVAAALATPRRGRAEAPRFSTLLLTLLAWHASRGELRGDALPADVTADFLRNVASRRTAGPEAPLRALEGWIVSARQAYALDAREAAVLAGFGRACLEQLAAECGALDPGVPVDPRYVSCLLVES